jgi:hypothetical protein
LDPGERQGGAHAAGPHHHAPHHHGGAHGHHHPPAHPAGSPCTQVAAIVAATIRQLLIERAETGFIRVEDVLAVTEHVEKGHGGLAMVLAERGAACLKQHAHGTEIAQRRDPFHRLMVRPIETMLTGEQPDFPRAMLGNYFRLIDAASGDLLNKYTELCRAVLQSLLVQHGHQLNWEQFYADSRVRHILAHALRHMMAFLGTPAGQWLWGEMMEHPDSKGHTLPKEQTDRIRRALQDTWRGLEMDKAKDTKP